MRVLLAGLLLVASLGPRVAAQAGQARFDFEQDQPGAAPAGWSFNAAQLPGARAQVSGENHKSGTRALVVARDAPQPNPAILLQSVDAAPYRGKRVRYRFATRVEAAATAQLWLRVDLPPVNGQPPMAFFDNMDDRPISSRDWTFHEIVGDVDPKAARVFFGAMAFGTGRVWLDDGSLEIVGTAPVVAPEGPGPLTRRGFVNLAAFTRLLGYVRHFHPSDGVARANWNAVAIAGVRSVESSPDAAVLAKRLSQLFAPIAPTVEVFTTGSPRPSARDTTPPVDGQKLLAWRHMGFAQGTGPGLYRSERIAAQAPDVFETDLGGGVTARIPLTVAADDAGTLPRVPPAVTPSTPQPTREVLSPADRAVRLAGVVLAWNVFEHFYPYFDVVKTDWPAALGAALRGAATANGERGYVDTLRSLVAALHDGHGRVATTLDTPFLPPVAWDWIGDRLVVVAAHESTMLVPGDAVNAIDGVNVEQLLRDREALISGATPQWVRWRAVQELAAGPPKTSVTLEVERFGAPARTERVVVTRSATPQPFAERRPDKIVELEPGIYYVDLDRVVDADVTSAMPKLEAARGIVFDLRGYPRLQDPLKLFGHLSSTPMTSAQWHVPIVTRPDATPVFVRQGEWQIPPIAPPFKARLAFITDGRAISYAESLMGIVEHYRLGAIVGAPTAGTNGNVATMLAPGNVTMVFTGMKVLKHDGSQHHGVGIQPTVPVARTRAGVGAGRDELIENAIEEVRR
jgi:C-terminal processing protease CtpA/Prc